jgi:hypothetical protein
MYATGGTGSPLRLLVYVHIVAVTLLTSPRTALKVALWHTLLFLVLLEAGTGSSPLRGLVTKPPTGEGWSWVEVLHVATTWMMTLTAIACSALSERALRSQKVDLERLSMMVAAFDQSRNPSDIARTLLEELHEAYGFPRAALLGSPRGGDLALLGSLGAVGRSALEPGLDPLMERAWVHREVVLVRRLDRTTDRRLARLFPDARNILVVPLFLAGGSRLGLLLLEHPASDRIPTWTVSTVRRFAFHAALALRSAWSAERPRADLAKAAAGR